MSLGYIFRTLNPVCAACGWITCGCFALIWLTAFLARYEQTARDARWDYYRNIKTEILVTSYNPTEWKYPKNHSIIALTNICYNISRIHPFWNELHIYGKRLDRHELIPHRIPFKSAKITINEQRKWSMAIFTNDHCDQYEGPVFPEIFFMDKWRWLAFNVPSGELHGWGQIRVSVLNLD